MSFDSFHLKLFINFFILSLFQDSGAITISLVQNGWSAREQIQLLDSIEKFGFGNWEDISKTIETKSPDGKNYSI